MKAPRSFRARRKISTFVVNHYGRLGTAFAETDLRRANHETTIADLMEGQHDDPLRVIMFNPETDRSDNVSHAIARVDAARQSAAHHIDEVLQCP